MYVFFRIASFLSTLIGLYIASSMQMVVAYSPYENTMFSCVTTRWQIEYHGVIPLDILQYYMNNLDEACSGNPYKWSNVDTFLTPYETRAEVLAFDTEKVRDVIYAPNGVDYAYIIEENGTYRLLTADAESDAYSHIHTVQYENDGKTISFVWVKNGYDAFVRDFEERERYKHILSVLYRPKSSEYSIISADEDGYSLTTNGDLIAQYDLIYNPLFSPDGKDFSYLAKDGDITLFVKNGTEQRIKNTTVSFVYHPIDSSISSILKVWDGYKYIYGQKESPSYEKIDGFRFSLDGKNYAFIGKRNYGYSFVKNGVESGVYSKVYNDFQLSPNTDGYIFKAIQSQAMVVVVDGRTSKKYRDIPYFSYSPSGYGHIYVWQDLYDGRYEVIKDGAIIGVYDRVFQLKYSPDGTSYAFVARRNNRHFIVLDGVEYEDTHYGIYNLSFSTNSQILSYVTVDDGVSTLMQEWVH